jgi:hypothetical protein
MNWPDALVLTATIVCGTILIVTVIVVRTVRKQLKDDAWPMPPFHGSAPSSRRRSQ